MIGQRLQDPQGLSLERRRLRGEGPPSPRSLAKGYPTLRAPPPPPSHLECIVDEGQRLLLAHVVALALAEQRPGQLARKA